MRTFGIGIDNYKLPVFERNLKAANLSIEIWPATIPDAKFIRVETDNHGRMAEIIMDSNE